MPIRVLSPLLVNQIAAGEVVERPASVVKELVENSVDAGATRIEVVIEAGGCDRIEITDDGGGIASDELLLALASHATSKISGPEDLEAIATMGFRGEALASIASVSRIVLRSRTAETGEASLVEGEGTQFAPPRPAPGPVGTQVTVRNLFFNTPARRKFLRTPTTEGTRVAEVMRDLALAHPSVSMRLVSDGRTKLDLPPGLDIEARIRTVIDADEDLTLIPVEAAEGGISISGFVAPPAAARSTSRRLHIVLNGRPISDRTAQHALREAYRGLIEPAAWPVAVLYIVMDPGLVDVNVHPAKSEVRFRDPGLVHRVIRHCVREALSAAKIVPAVDLSRFVGEGGSTAPPQEQSAGASSGSRQGVSWTSASSSAYRPGSSAGNFGGASGGSHGRGAAPYAPGGSGRPDGPRGFDYARAAEALQERGTPEDGTGAPARDDAPEIELLSSGQPAVRAMQVHSSYIVTQDAEGLIIIDQHALHERIMFEKLRGRLTDGPLEAQRLLAPETIEVSAAELEGFEQLRPLLSRLGIDAEAMGPRTVGVHAFPALLLERRVDPGPFVRDLIRRAAEEGRLDDPEQALSEVLDMMACKAAVKAGDRLSPSEIDALLRMREEVERSTNCPHGRPTSLRIGIADLEKQFGRR